MIKLKVGWLIVFLLLAVSDNLFAQAEISISESNSDINGLVSDLNITQGPKDGTLFIIGGGALDIFYQKFKELVGGPDAPIVVIPTASTSYPIDEDYLQRFKANFTRRGFNNVTMLHTRDLDEANSNEFVEPIRNASGVWFNGGRQWRLADSYLNTLTHEALWDLLARGGVISGSSAGATIQGSYLARGDTQKNTIMMGDHEEGLGFITNVAIDQHLLERNRL